MPALRPTPHQLLSPLLGLRQSNPLRRGHNRLVTKGASTAKPQKHQLSLLEELFPEEIDNRKSHQVESRSEENPIPRLPLPNVDEVNQLYQKDRTEGRIQQDGISRAALMERDSLRQWNLAVLVIRRASKSLVESDFRRIALQSRQLIDCKAPGEILKGMYKNLGSHFTRTSS